MCLLIGENTRSAHAAHGGLRLDERRQGTSGPEFKAMFSVGIGNYIDFGVQFLGIIIRRQIKERIFLFTFTYHLFRIIHEDLT